MIVGRSGAVVSLQKFNILVRHIYLASNYVPFEVLLQETVAEFSPVF